MSKFQYVAIAFGAIALASASACSSAVAGDAASRPDDTATSQRGGSKYPVPTSTPTAVSFAITPDADTLRTGESVQLSTSAVWSDGKSHTFGVAYSATGGSVTSNGMYSAGSIAGNFLIIATCTCARVDTAHAIVLPPAAPTLAQLVLTPTSVALSPNATRQFAVAGVWSDGSMKDPAPTYTATGGSVSSTGLYTAGATPGTYRVIATDRSGAKADTSSVTITAPPRTLTRLVITPKSTTLAGGATQQFAVAATWSDGSTATPAVSYSASGGMITSSGAYTAPSAAGSYRVVVTTTAGSAADTSIVTVSGVVLSANAYTRPFSDASPWNTPVAKYGSVSVQSTNAFAGFMPAMATWPGALWVSMYQAKASDPLVNLYYNANAWINVASGRWKRSGNSPAVEAEIRASMDQKWAGYQGNMYSTTTAGISALPASFHARESSYWSLQARIPANAVPSSDADGHLTVFQPNGWALEMLAPIRLSNGDFVSLFASYTDPTGLGAGDANGRRASMVPNYAGILRNGELGSGHIAHALAVGVGPEALAKSVVWPASAMDRETSNYTGPLPMGAFLTIPAGVDLTKLGLQTAQGKTLAKAAQEYGMYVMDQTGPKYLLILSEKDVADVPSWSGPLDADLRVIMAQLKLTTAAGRK